MKRKQRRMGTKLETPKATGPYNPEVCRSTSFLRDSLKPNIRYRIMMQLGEFCTQKDKAEYQFALSGTQAAKLHVALIMNDIESGIEESILDLTRSNPKTDEDKKDTTTAVCMLMDRYNTMKREHLAEVARTLTEEARRVPKLEDKLASLQALYCDARDEVTKLHSALEQANSNLLEANIKKEELKTEMNRERSIVDLLIKLAGKYYEGL